MQTLVSLFWFVFVVSFLSSVQSIPTTFSSFVSTGSLDFDSNINIELNRVREHFSKLKLGFLHLEAKQRLLAELVTDNEDKQDQHNNTVTMAQLITPEQQIIEQLQSRVQQGRKQIRTVHTQNMEKMSAVKEKVESLIQSK